jgi:hypothetical protein
MPAYPPGDVDHAAALLEAVPLEDGVPAQQDEDPDTAVLHAVVATRLALARGRHREAEQAATLITPLAVEEAPLRALARRPGATRRPPPNPSGRATTRRRPCPSRGTTSGPTLIAQARTTLAFSLVYGDQLATAVGHAHAVLDLAARHGWKDTPGNGAS